MTSVFLINVGANTSHTGSARSPIFEDGKFVFVPFPDKGARDPSGYTAAAFPFTRGVERCETHADPDWVNRTYGDYCKNRRARALLTATAGDLLLFWGLLWSNDGTDWHGFSNDRPPGWYLIGALRIEEIVTDKQVLADVSAQNRARAAANVHFSGGEKLDPEHRVFIGDRAHSWLFHKAVDLGVAQPDGLVYRAIKSAQGQPLTFQGRPRWNSSLRSCRRVFDLSNADDLERFRLVQAAVLSRADVDLLSH